MLKLARRLYADKSGATAIEYGLIVAVLSLAMIAGFAQFGNSLENMLSHPQGELQESLRRHQ